MKQISTLVCLLFILFSCTNEIIDEQVNSKNDIEQNQEDDATPCGETMEVTLWAGQNHNSGTVTVQNDSDNLYVTYTTINGWQLQHTHLYVGHCDSIPTTNSGNPRIGHFPYSTPHNPRVTSFTYTIPLSDLDDCFCVAAHAELVKVNDDGEIIQTETGWGEGETIGGNSWAMKFEYCIQECNEEECVIEAGDYRTQTQGGWGSEPTGNNPGAYLHTNFAVAFPSGLVVGCQAGNTLTFTSAQAITDFLPQGGTPAILSASYVDPQDLNNVLAGQIVALTISVNFDVVFDDFGASSSFLGNLVITSGTFEGWSVNQLLAEANNIFGGCTSAYSPSQINDALSQINQNFVDGLIVGDFLTCGENNGEGEVKK